MSEEFAERSADLHLHSVYSDGSDTPVRIAERAKIAGLAAFALTDHDTVAGLPEAEAAAQEEGLAFLNGVEISSNHRGQEVHVLGYGIDRGHAELNDTFQRLQRDRERRVERIVSRLNDSGIAIDLERVRNRSNGAIGRMHVAQELKAAGQASGVQNAFDRFLKHGRVGYVPKPLLEVAEAVDLIRRARGLAFLAHPGLGRQGKRLRDLLDVGFDGIEAFHSKHTREQTQRYLALAEERGLLVSGGSDCHGTAKHHRPEMGKVRLPWRYWEAIRGRLEVVAS